jgi:hypothetical protein
MRRSALNSSQKLIVRLLQEVARTVGTPIYRTHLVKLAYLADYTYARHTGRTISGLQYVYDNYGPNAEGNEIVKQADRLKTVGLIAMGRGSTPNGNSRYLYQADTGPEVTLGDELAEKIVGDVVRAYGALYWRDVVVASKKTKPFERAKRGDRLAIGLDQAMAALEKRVSQSGQDYVSIKRSRTARELKAQYGIP